MQNDVLEKWSRFLQGSHMFQGLQVRDLTEAPISTEAFKVHTKIVEQRCVLLDCVIYRNEFYFQSSSVANNIQF